MNAKWERIISRNQSEAFVYSVYAGNQSLWQHIKSAEHKHWSTLTCFSSLSFPLAQLLESVRLKRFWKGMLHFIRVLEYILEEFKAPHGEQLIFCGFHLTNTHSVAKCGPFTKSFKSMSLFKPRSHCFNFNRIKTSLSFCSCQSFWPSHRSQCDQHITHLCLDRQLGPPVFVCLQGKKGLWQNWCHSKTCKCLKNYVPPPLLKVFVFDSKYEINLWIHVWHTIARIVHTCIWSNNCNDANLRMSSGFLASSCPNAAMTTCAWLLK